MRLSRLGAYKHATTQMMAKPPRWKPASCKWRWTHCVVPQPQKTSTQGPSQLPCCQEHVRVHFC